MSNFLSFEMKVHTVHTIKLLRLFNSNFEIVGASDWQDSLHTINCILDESRMNMKEKAIQATVKEV